MVERNKRSGGCRASAGFTLVELLVVISIIGMLMALLLPAVQSARETGRRNTCQSNQHNLSLALMQFCDNKKSYPGWNNWLNGAAANNANATGSLQYAEVTFIVPLLTYLDQNPIYNNYTTYLNSVMAGNGSTDTAHLYALGQSQVYMAILTCPSNPSAAQAGSTPLAYIINGGQIDASSGGGGTPIVQGGKVLGTAVATTRSLQTIAASSGIAYDQTGYSSIGATTSLAGPIVKVNQDFISSNDGTTYTLLLSENTLATSSWSLLSNGTSLTTGPSTALSPQVSGTTTASTQLNTTTFMWVNSGTGGESAVPSTTSAPYNGINGDRTNSTAADIYHARPASYHNGVCVVAFAGGNVRPLNEDIDYRTYKQLMTPFGGSTTSTASISGSGDLDSITWPIDESKF